MRQIVTLPVVEDVHDYTPEELAEALHKAKFVEKLLKAVAAEAKRRLDDPGCNTKPPGWTLKDGRRNRAWIDEASAVAAMKAAGVEPHKTVLKSPPDAEKELGVKPDESAELKSGYEWEPGGKVLDSTMPAEVPLIVKLPSI